VLVTWYYACDTCGDRGFVRYHHSVTQLTVAVQVMGEHPQGHTLHVTRAPKPLAPQAGVTHLVTAPAG
jgi:hypothetical protein